MDIEINDITKSYISKIEAACMRIKPKIAINCIAYNQEKYIRDTLEGFIMQKADFPFIAIVHDDASTDSTPEIIREYAEKYPDIIFPIYEKENQYSKKDGSIFFIMSTAIKSSGATYTAYCEGDDYWIDCHKLAKQFDFMEQHPNISLCFHAVNEKFENSNKPQKIRDKVYNREYSAVEWFSKRPSQTSSFFLRTTVYDTKLWKYVASNSKKFPVGDIPLLLSCTKIGGLYGLSDIMSTYRHNEGGWTTKKKDYDQTVNILNSQLNYSIFGKELVPSCINFYQRGCVQEFYSSLRRGKFDIRFLAMSSSKSILGTLKQLFKVPFQHYFSHYQA